MTILVTGATGNVGKEVVKHLLAAGAQVRALTRDPDKASFPPEVEVVQGDLLEPETIRPALAGVTAMHLFSVPETAAQVVELAKQAGVRRIVVLSSDAVTDKHDDGYHLVVEKAVENSGLEWTHVRPGEFALNKRDSWSEPIRQGHVRLAFPDAKGMPVHETDIGAVAAAALVNDGHAGKIYRPTAPEATTQREQVMAIANAVGKEVTIEVITPEQEKEEMLQVGWPVEVIDYLHSYFKTWTDHPPEARPDVAEATGKRAHTLAEWAADHADDFR
ncbi:SDR family oxidoreductase [Micromonospora sp. NBC_01739]|uniref:SDR family oxidoreductase n=1 Tax=Micromonospora sp. NBC_01739 TaxID=2975985 RepID=UPI002E0E1C26|nr:NAD(P)H-binding protein [Micromonospora sp. NBC_01739]